MARHVPRGCVKRGLVQNVDDDKQFPFHSETETVLEALNPVDRSNFEPPSSTIRKIYFREASVVDSDFGQTILTPHETPRHFNETRGWELYTAEDVALACGFAAFCPSGSTRERVRRINKGYRQPFLHPMHYEPVKLKPEDPKAGGEYVCKAEESARRFLSGSRQQYVISGGHPERPRSPCVHDCCMLETEPDDAIRQRRFANDAPECSMNSSTHTVFGALNLNDPALESGLNFTHVYQITKRPQSHPKMQSHIETIENSLLTDDYVLTETINNRRMSEREFGIVELHSATEMSMALREATMMEEKRLPFLSASEVVQEKKLLSQELGPVG